MALRGQALVTLLAMALMLPSIGAPWAYCQQAGRIHAVADDGCCAAPGDASPCGCGDSHGPRHCQSPCCVGAGKLVPDAVMPAADRVAGPVPCALALAPGGDAGAAMPGVRAALGGLLLRAPPPPVARFLALRSLRL